MTSWKPGRALLAGVERRAVHRARHPKRMRSPAVVLITIHRCRDGLIQLHDRERVRPHCATRKPATALPVVEDQMGNSSAASRRWQGPRSSTRLFLPALRPFAGRSSWAGALSLSRPEDHDAVWRFALLAHPREPVSVAQRRYIGPDGEDGGRTGIDPGRISLRRGGQPGGVPVGGARDHGAAAGRAAARVEPRPGAIGPPWWRTRWSSSPLHA